MAKYDEWSRGWNDENHPKKVLIAYVSAYGYTRKLAEALAEGAQKMCIRDRHYVASDGCALFMREAVDAMDDETFELYLKYHFATCEREDMLGITSHSIDIFRK